MRSENSVSSELYQSRSLVVQSLVADKQLNIFREMIPPSSSACRTVDS